jgi:DNA-binding transcriptional regulator YiaG
MDRMEFRSRRRAAGLTMKATGRLLGVCERTVWRWEHGTSAIDPWKAQAVREKLIPGVWAKGTQQDTKSGPTPTK